MTVMIGIDPHKRSHTAHAIDRNETELAALTVRSSARQVDQLLGWAAAFGDREWAVESANGLGYLLSQQLVAAGEVVIDVPPTLAARVRLLGTGKTNKNDPNDARSVGIAALRQPGLARVQEADHASVLRLLAKRSVELAQSRNRSAGRLHALLTELVPGGLSREFSVTRAETLLASIEPVTATQRTRCRVAGEHLDDLRRLETQQRQLRLELRDAVAASGTTLTDLYGVGPIVAGLIIGYTGDITRFANRDRYAAYNGTAPIEVSSGGRVVHRLSRRGNRQLNHALHIIAMVQIRHRDSEGRAFYDRKLADGHTRLEAIRALKRHISDRVYRQLVLDHRS